MSYKVINEKLRISTVDISEMTMEQVQCCLSQLEENAKIGSLTLFYDNVNDLIVINKDHQDSILYLKLAERVLTAGEEYLRKLVNEVPEPMAKSLQLLVEIRQKRFAQTEINRALENDIPDESWPVLEMLLNIRKCRNVDPVVVALKYGVMIGKRQERSRRRKRNVNRQHMNLKQQITELIEGTSNIESLELIYRFCRKLLREA